MRKWKTDLQFITMENRFATYFIDNLGQFFEEFVKCVGGKVAGQSSEYEPANNMQVIYP